MKRVGNLWEKICSFENLYLASKKALRRKARKRGANVFFSNLEYEIHEIRRELLDGAYVCGKYDNFLVTEPKQRMVSAAPFRDRVVHHALCNVIEPIWEKRFIYDSYACRVGKGTHKAIDRAHYFLRKYQYVLKCDVAKYFPSIDHDVLMDMVQSKIKCGKTLALIQDIIKCSPPECAGQKGYFPGDDIVSVADRRIGLPIGNLTSQFFANVYLDGLDHFIKDECGIKGYLRYMDDFALFSNDKAELKDMLGKIESFVSAIRLNLNHGKCQLFPAKNGFPFLGFHLYRERRRILRGNFERFKKRVLGQRWAYRHGTDVSIFDFRESVRAWNAFASFGDTHSLRKKFFRSIIWKKGGSAALVCRRVLRGGNYENDMENLRASERNINNPDNRNNDNGFRCVCSAP
jgi:hypothetical protein